MYSTLFRENFAWRLAYRQRIANLYPALFGEQRCKVQRVWIFLSLKRYTLLWGRDHLSGFTRIWMRHLSKRFTSFCFDSLFTKKLSDLLSRSDKKFSWWVQFEHHGYQKWICFTPQQMNKWFGLFAFLFFTLVY